MTEHARYIKAHKYYITAKSN